MSVFIISSCGSNPDKSTNEETNQNDGSPSISDAINNPALENDSLSSNIPDNKKEDNDTINADPDIHAHILVDEEPKPVNFEAIMIAIGYPSKAKDARIEGKVIVRILVGKDGEYMQHSIISNAHPILSDAVASQVKNLQFTPALKEGQAVKFWVTLPFNFKLVK
ncbi:energy transducer TonB [Cyclobacterium qasimii]|uniref:TonB C-terminal domain-containing protein n=1 Tax=Cyclobacterium qasimii M12-11B TaxID=641524 RepID=S7VNL7_9BACT|nr:energy transducer TonB [Cyclobacterium qasimii]EPR71571.1 hypothetical protein ADICYQ_0239 [Cyclobacterium qasimii M12-11B]